MLSPELQAIVFMIIGLVCVVIGFKQTDKRKKIIANGVEVEGVVFDTEYVSSYDNSSESFEYPIIRFVTKKDMIWITERYETGLLGFMTKGEKVKVIYDADNPKNFIVKAFFDPGKLFYLLPAIGIVLFVIGIAMVFKYLTHGN